LIILFQILPEDAHLRVNGKVHISLTRVYDRKNVIVSQFNSRDELIQAILCASFIPIFSGWLPPKFQGETRYMDGCYSDNLPILDENTITVSPFCGESDICPRDTTVNLLQVNLSNTSIELSRQNLYRFSRTLFPPKAEILSKMCQQGFDDTLRFLARHDMIGCTSCMSTDTTMSLGEELDEMSTKNYERIISEESCHQCKVQKEAAFLDGLPETVVSILQDAIDSGNKGLLNWLFSHQSVRILSLMSLPCILPADMAYATAIKLFDSAPKLTYNLRILSEAVIQLITQAISKWGQSPSAGFITKLTCQLDVNVYNKVDIEAPAEKTLQRRSSSKMNFGFTLNYDNRESHHYKMDSRRGSIVGLIDGDEDTFERILKVTSYQDNVKASYYMDMNERLESDHPNEFYSVYESSSSALPPALPPSAIFEV